LPKYAQTKGVVMILDGVCGVTNDPDREARRPLPPMV
jgi:hypothetical protein